LILLDDDCREKKRRPLNSYIYVDNRLKSIEAFHGAAQSISWGFFVLTFLMHGRTGAVALVGRAHFTLQMEEKEETRNHSRE
jgi:hypothetical protein